MNKRVENGRNNSFAGQISGGQNCSVGFKFAEYLKNKNKKNDRQTGKTGGSNKS
jgi:hypothetical protein